MARTYELIAKTTLGSDAASVTLGSGGTIPQTYTDMLLLLSARSSRADTWASTKIRFNGASTDTNLTSRELYGSGSGVASANYTTYAYTGVIPANTATASTFGNLEIYIPNYAGATNKSFSVTYAQEHNAAAAYLGAVAGLWSSTSAITELTIIDVHGNLKSGTAVYLYGITKA